MLRRTASGHRAPRTLSPPSSVLCAGTSSPRGCWAEQQGRLSLGGCQARRGAQLYARRAPRRLHATPRPGPVHPGSVIYQRTCAWVALPRLEWGLDATAGQASLPENDDICANRWASLSGGAEGTREPKGTVRSGVPCALPPPAPRTCGMGVGGSAATGVRVQPRPL